MKIAEILRENNESIAQLTTVLNFLKSRAGEEKSSGILNTRSLINLVSNTGVAFDYAALVAANKDKPAVKNLIKTFNKRTVTLQLDDEEDNTESNVETQDKSAVTVDNMAKKAKDI